MAQEALAEQPQPEERRAEQECRRGRRHREARTDQARTYEHRVDTQIHAIELATEPHDAETTYERRDRVDAAVVTLGQDELLAHLLAERPDEERLPEAREEREREAKQEEAGVAQDEGQVVHGADIVVTFEKASVLCGRRYRDDVDGAVGFNGVIILLANWSQKGVYPPLRLARTASAAVRLPSGDQWPSQLWKYSSGALSWRSASNRKCTRRSTMRTVGRVAA